MVAQSACAKANIMSCHLSCLFFRADLTSFSLKSGFPRMVLRDDFDLIAPAPYQKGREQHAKPDSPSDI